MAEIWILLILLVTALSAVYLHCVVRRRAFFWQWLTAVATAVIVGLCSGVFGGFVGSFGAWGGSALYRERWFGYLARVFDANTVGNAEIVIRASVSNGEWSDRIMRLLPPGNSIYLIYAGIVLLGMAMASAFLYSSKWRIPVAAVSFLSGIVLLSGGYYQSGLRSTASKQIQNLYAEHLLMMEQLFDTAEQSGWSGPDIAALLRSYYRQFPDVCHREPYTELLDQLRRPVVREE